MLHHISWGQFLTVTVVLMAIYYGYIIIAYFRKDICAAAKKKFTGTIKESQAVPPAIPDLPPPVTNDWDIHAPAVHELMAGLSQTFSQCVGQKFNKPELMMAIQLRLDGYPQLKGTAFQVSVNNHIETEALGKCATTLSLDEIKSLW